LMVPSTTWISRTYRSTRHGGVALHELWRSDRSGHPADRVNPAPNLLHGTKQRKFAQWVEEEGPSDTAPSIENANEGEEATER
jgi:hypothetical protein